MVVNMPETITPYDNLPNFVKNAFFCLTLKGSKKPFDPYSKKVIGPNDNFYNYETIAPMLLKFPGSSLGLKVGSNNITAIDFDKCVDPETKVINEKVLNCLSFLDIKNCYVEYSPSGTGIRVLFKTKTPFDPKLYYIKNSADDIEYYDAAHCNLPEKSRMVRISGNPLFLQDTTKFDLVDTQLFLDSFMRRKGEPSIIGSGDCLFSDTPNEHKVRVITYLTSVLPVFFNYNNRYVYHKSESEWDFFMVNEIASYTKNRKEIIDILKGTKYFLTKDLYHLKKWQRQTYIDQTLSRVSSLLSGNTFIHEVVQHFDRTPDFEKLIARGEVSGQALTKILFELGIVKVNKKTKNDFAMDDLLVALYYAATMKITALSWSSIKNSIKH